MNVSGQFSGQDLAVLCYELYLVMLCLLVLLTPRSKTNQRTSFISQGRDDLVDI